MNIRIVGAHASAAGIAGCMSILVDGKLALDAGSLGALTLEEQGELEAVFISHRHFDHLRDLPLLALNLFRMEKAVAVYGNNMVIDSLKNHVFNRDLYPRFHEIPASRPTLGLKPLVAGVTEQVAGYEVSAVAVNHDGDSAGFYVAGTGGDSFFYSGDTGPGLCPVLQRFSPRRLLIEVTLPNRYDGYAQKTGHLTPGTLHDELCRFRRLRGYLPEVVAVHLDPTLESEIRHELGLVADNLGVPIQVAYEGLELGARGNAGCAFLSHGVN
jgi:cAMP phosphodiesterase